MLFRKTKELVIKIDNFIDLTEQAGLHLKQGVKLYIESRYQEFEERLDLMRETENRADFHRKEIEEQLYTQTLIPESRGDVLGILESMDSVIDRVKFTLLEFSIERPHIPDSLKAGFLEMVDPVKDSISALCGATRSYFYDINGVKNYLNKVKFYEKESDMAAERMKREVYKMELGLSAKMHLGTFIRNIDSLADKSEIVSDRLSIAAIKRIV